MIINFFLICIICLNRYDLCRMYLCCIIVLYCGSAKWRWLLYGDYTGQRRAVSARTSPSVVSGTFTTELCRGRSVHFNMTFTLEKMLILEQTMSQNRARVTECCNARRRYNKCLADWHFLYQHEITNITMTVCYAIEHASLLDALAARQE